MLCGFVFNLQIKRDVKGKRDTKNKKRMYRDIVPKNNSNYESIHPSSYERDNRTIELIGEEAYEKMTKQIDKVLRRHSGQPCVTINLTCGPDTIQGADELHSLLPGMELQLVKCGEAGTECIDVYHNGKRIGRLALAEATIVKDILERERVCGTYVAEQNCYGLDENLQLSIIVFYKARSKKLLIKDIIGLKGITKNEKNDIISANICQN